MVRGKQRNDRVASAARMRINPSLCAGQTCAGLLVGRQIHRINPEGKVIEALTNIDRPSGVSIDVKMT